MTGTRVFKRYQQVHFVGIGGVGMSGLAEVILTLGYRVTGSDARRGEAVERLERLGAKIHVGHAAGHIEGAHVVVYSSAVARDNPELQAARQRGVPVIPRAEMLAELMRVKHGIAIAGTHGKTTTTSMVGAVLAEAGFDPTLVVGGRVTALGANARLGQGEFLVAEADESDGSFLRLTPTIAVVTTIDAEHLDYYRDLAAIREAFLSFVTKVPFYGAAVLCADQPEIQAILPRVEKRVITYGLGAPADLVAASVRLERADRALRSAPARGLARRAPAPGAGTPQRGQCPGGRRGGARPRGAVRRGPARARRLHRRPPALPGEGRGRRASWWSTTTATIRRRSGPPWPPRARASRVGGSSCSSRTATRGRSTSTTSS